MNIIFKKMYFKNLHRNKPEYIWYFILILWEALITLTNSLLQTSKETPHFV